MTAEALGERSVGREVEGHHRAGAAGEERVADAPGALERGEGAVVEAEVGAPAPGPGGGVDVGQQVVVGEAVDQAAGPEEALEVGGVDVVDAVRVEGVAPDQRRLAEGAGRRSARWR